MIGKVVWRIYAGGALINSALIKVADSAILIVYVIDKIVHKHLLVCRQITSFKL